MSRGSRRTAEAHVDRSQPHIISISGQFLMPGSSVANSHSAIRHNTYREPLLPASPCTALCNLRTERVSTIQLAGYNVATQSDRNEKWRKLIHFFCQTTLPVPATTLLISLRRFTLTCDFENRIGSEIKSAEAERYRKTCRAACSRLDACGR